MYIRVLSFRSRGRRGPPRTRRTPRTRSFLGSRDMALEVMDVGLRVGVVVGEKQATDQVARKSVPLGFTKKLQHNLTQFMLDLGVLGFFLLYAEPD